MICIFIVRLADRLIDTLDETLRWFLSHFGIFTLKNHNLKLFSLN